MMTGQYQGGEDGPMYAIGSTPNQPRIVFASPKRTPLKMDSLHTSEATTYEQAVGRKNTERKKVRRILARRTSSARPRARAKVSGTMKAANSVKVIRLLTNGPPRSRSAKLPRPP